MAGENKQQRFREDNDMKAYENEYKDYNQFQLGDTHSATRVIYAEDIERFAEVSGDFNAIHLD